MGKQSRLVEAHLEDLSLKVFRQQSKTLREIIGGKHGIYALYKNRRLYYVGLASNLFTRIRLHQSDKHGGKWNRFSVYLTRRQEQMSELESLALRIIAPPGNLQTGRFSGSKNLKPIIRREVQRLNKLKDAELFGGKHAHRQRRKAASTARGFEALKVLTGRRRLLWARYKSADYSATLLKNGLIRYRGNNYKSPSAAAKAIVGRSCNGWSFWFYEIKQGEWWPLKNLR